MTREIEWVEFTKEDGSTVAIGHDTHADNDVLWLRIEFEKNGAHAKAVVPLTASTIREYLNKWFPPDTPRQESAQSPGTETPGEPQK